MKHCAECNEKIVGREDKKFCSDGCRNIANNRLNKDSSNFMRRINNKLRKNYRILAELNGTGKTKIPKSELEAKGFDFVFFTNLRKVKKDTYHFIYNQGYRATKNNYFLLINRDPDKKEDTII